MTIASRVAELINKAINKKLKDHVEKDILTEFQELFKSID